MGAYLLGKKRPEMKLPNGITMASGHKVWTVLMMPEINDTRIRLSAAVGEMKPSKARMASCKLHHAPQTNEQRERETAR